MARLSVGRQVRWGVGAALFLIVAWLVPAIHGQIVSLLGPVVVVVRQPVDKLAETVQVIKAIPQLTSENKYLVEQVQQLEADKLTTIELQHENDLLRHELGFTQAHSTETFVPSQVISRSSSIVGQTLIINKGANDGLKKDMAVVAQGFLVGRIGNLTPTSADVTLITSRSSLVPVVLQQSRSVGLLKGGAGGLELDEIPRDITMSVGEGVVTAPLGNVIASGLPVGQVSTILGVKSDVFQSARIVSPIDFSRLELVFVVKQ